MNKKLSQSAAIIVAHPDDETIWAGGTVLMHPNWQWTIMTLCRASDPDRAPKFFQVLKELRAQGGMGDLDDGPEQVPLPSEVLIQEITSLLPEQHFDLLLTHSTFGEYTRHRRHEETGHTVVTMWKEGCLSIDELWMFAYADSGLGGKNDPPRPIEEAHRKILLPEEIRREKYRIITQVYGFSPESYEAVTIPQEEAFWCFSSPVDLEIWLNARRRKL